MSVENHPPYPADQVTGTGEKGQDHGPVRKAAHISLPWGIISNWPMWPSGRGRVDGSHQTFINRRFLQDFPPVFDTGHKAGASLSAQD